MGIEHRQSLLQMKMKAHIHPCQHHRKSVHPLYVAVVEHVLVLIYWKYLRTEDQLLTRKFIIDVNPYV